MSNNHPFAIDYGIQVGYRLTNRLHLIAEISGLTTTRSFDAVGTSARFGDTMLNLSAGLSVTIGKTGWKRTVDARPYVRQNDYLLERCRMLETQLDQCKNKNEENASLSKNYRNDYRGLNSLRFRMSAEGANYDEEANADSSLESNPKESITIGVPVFFYFKLNSNHLVDESQLSNLDEIAKLAISESLNISISGSADNATGNERVNQKLSKSRAQYIGQELVSRGVSREKIMAVSRGGIDKYTPIEANRLTVVVLSR